MTRTELQTGGDAAIVASLTELMVTYLSEAHCIMPDQASPGRAARPRTSRSRRGGRAAERRARAMSTRVLMAVVAILILIGIGTLLIRPSGDDGSQPQHAITQD